MKRMLALLAIGLLTTALGTATTAFAQCVSTPDGSGVVAQILFAGQTVDAGTVSVRVVDQDLAVTYTTTGGWELVQAQLWVGHDVADMPQAGTGNPKVGNFPYHSGDITGATSYTFLVPLADLGFSCPNNDHYYYVAAHADLRKLDGTGGFQTETGWADGDRIVEQGSWATYFSVPLTCACESGGDAGQACETDNFEPNHFKCYAVEEGDSVDVVVDLADQFGVEPGVLVGTPKFFCNPVDKNGEGIGDPTAYLTCYEIEGSYEELEVVVENQFDEQTLEVEGPKILCVPSLMQEIELEDSEGLIDEDDDDDDGDDNGDDGDDGDGEGDDD